MLKQIDKKQGGFTLIELMIVIAIIGVLAAIALPAYQDYIVRAKLTGPMAMLAKGKTAVSAYVSSTGSYPDNIATFGLNSTRGRGEILYAVGVGPSPLTDGDTIYIGAGIYNSVWEGGEPNDSEYSVFSLSGSTSADGTMRWDCIPGWVPGSGEDPVPVEYLPANCRG